jgi:hypothetical protein
MTLTGRCYCGALRYEAEGPARFKGQCHCRECQYISGGAENLFMIMGADGFKYVQGEPRQFSRQNLEGGVTREFCGTCGTHILTRSPLDTSMVVLKIGTLDDPKTYEGPQAAIWTADAQPFHRIPEGIANFKGFPGR